MPYKNNRTLPKGVKNSLPKHGQDIYREAFNHAIEQYEDASKRHDSGESLEEVSHKVAWNAVKQKYHKDKKGVWVAK